MIGIGDGYAPGKIQQKVSRWGEQDYLASPTSDRAHCIEVMTSWYDSTAQDVTDTPNIKQVEKDRVRYWLCDHFGRIADENKDVRDKAINLSKGY